MSKLSLVLLIIAIVLAVVLGFAIHFYLDARRTAENEKAKGQQNDSAYVAQLNQKANHIQDLASFVVTLNDSLTKEQKKTKYWKAVTQENKVLIDSLKQQGTGIASSGEDSVGKYLRVDFSGKQDIVSYAGWTKYYPTPLSLRVPTTRYFVTAGFDTIPLSSVLYQDEEGIWKIRAETTAPGVKLLVHSTIDDKIYIGMRDAVEGEFQKARHYLPPFGLRFKANMGVKSSDLKAAQFNSVLFDGSAEIYYKNYNVTYYAISGVVSAGVVYIIDVSVLIESIF